MSLATVVRTYSDLDMACPSDFHNGYKEGLVASFGDGERMLSNPRDGSRGPATMDIDLIDDRRFREQFAGGATFWPGSLAWDVWMTSRANREVKGPAYCVFVGTMKAWKPTWGGQKRGIKVTLADLFTQVMSGNTQKDRGLIPWRIIGDSGLVNGELLTVFENLDRGTPETFIYGPHKRVPDVNPASPQGFCVTPTYLGTRDLSGIAYHVWMVCGHATYDIDAIRVDGANVIADEGSQWLVPHHAGYAAQFGGAVYEDFTDVFGRLRRYTLIYGLVTDPFADPADMTDPDACAAGHKQLTAAVEGVESGGNGLGVPITDRILQRFHFMVNCVANQGADSYHSGAWLANPTWDIFGASVEKINEASHDTASAIAIERLPSDGYLGAAVIGRTSSDRHPADYWREIWDRCCGGMSGPNRFGQDTYVMCHPTEDDRTNAPLVTDANEILLDSFDVDVRWPQHTNALPFKADLNPATGVYVTTDTATQDLSIEQWDQIDSEPVEYDFAPGITQSFHLAHMEVIRSDKPPVFIEFQTTTEEQNGDSLAYLDLGDYVNYRHVASVSNAEDEIRLAQIIAIQVQVGNRRVKCLAMDVDDLVGYDEPPTT